MTVGDRIRHKRIELGMTQEELAKKMGYNSKAAICKAERESENMTLDRVTKFAIALGVSESYLMGWEEINWEPETQEITFKNNNHYIDKEAKELAEFLHKNPEYSVLFDASKKVKPEDMQKALKAINLFIDEE